MISAEVCNNLWGNRRKNHNDKKKDGKSAFGETIKDC